MGTKRKSATSFREKLREARVRQDGVRELEETALPRRLFEEVPFAPHAGDERHHELFADRIDRWVRHLRELLLEVTKEGHRAIAQDGERGVVPHAPRRLFAGRRHWREEGPQVFSRVSEGALEALALVGGEGEEGGDRRQLGEVDLVVGDPPRVGLSRGGLALDLVVVDDFALGGVDEEHLPGLKAPLRDDVLRRDVEHPELAGQDDEAALRDDVLCRAEAVAIERRADERTVGKDQRGRPSQGSTRLAWYS